MEEEESLSGEETQGELFQRIFFRCCYFFLWKCKSPPWHKAKTDFFYKLKSTEYIGAFCFGAADEARTRIHTPTSDFMKVEEVSVLRIKEKTPNYIGVL